MDLRVSASGEVVERQELLNGTRTVAFEAVSEDGAWTVTGVVSWNLGLVDYAGEGDVALARGDGSEVYATLQRAELAGGSNEDGVRLAVEYEIDGGTGAFEAAGGKMSGEIRIREGEVEGDWRAAAE